MLEIALLPLKMISIFSFCLQPSPPAINLIIDLRANILKQSV